MLSELCPVGFPLMTPVISSKLRPGGSGRSMLNLMGAEPDSRRGSLGGISWSQAYLQMLVV
eukprot:763401-Hanusia_phi.AAC.3